MRLRLRLSGGSLKTNSRRFNEMFVGWSEGRTRDRDRGPLRAASFSQLGQAH